MRRRQSGQALPLVAFLGMVLLAGAIAVFTVGRAHAATAQAQTAADLVALSTGRELRAILPQIATDPDRSRAEWRRQVRTAANDIAQRNNARLTGLSFPDAPAWPPAQAQVSVDVEGPMGIRIPASARVAIVPGAGGLPEGWATGGGGQYVGPLVMRDGKPMCPVVADAFDRMDGAAKRVGVDLIVNSAFRSDAEQAVLFARHPDPKWVARPGTSRHRYSTELDISSANGVWGWLARHATAFGFVQRYSWEPWHYGYLPGCGAVAATGSAAPQPQSAASVASADELPPWVPAQYRELIVTSARNGGVPPIVLAALLKAESNFNPLAVSRVGAQGIAQFMPATARGMGLANPFDPQQAVPAAGRLLGGHLRAFGSIPLALAAYNAGPGAVTKYGGIPPYAETQAYVSRIMALAGDPTLADPVGAAEGVRLVRQGNALA